MKVFRLLLINVFFLLANEALATHAVGGEISYQYLDSNAYLVKVIFYRNCNGVSAPATIAVNVDNACGYSNMVAFLNVDTVEDISALCTGAISRCNGGTYRGYERYTYTGIVNLPGPCSRWTFSQVISSRSSEVTTIDINENLFIYADLNNFAEEHSSPEFAPISIPEACAGQLYCFTNLVTNPANDSIMYRLIDPLQGQSTPVTYLSVYSASQPILGSISVDSSNGSMCVTGSQVEVGVYSIEANQYRNGVLIGRIIRDLMLIVNNCSNTLPTLSGFDGSSNYAVNGCVNYNNCWFIASADADMDTTSIRSITPLPFPTTVSGNPTQLNICWTPQPSDLLNTPFEFQILVSDNNCPFSGIQSKVYQINLLDTNTNFCRLLLSEKEYDRKNKISFYPNPSDGNILFKNIDATYFLRVYDLSGKKVYAASLIKNQSALKLELENGIYLLSLTDEENNSVMNSRLIISKN